MNVKNEADQNVNGATIYALVFTNNGPDAVNSRVGVTVNGTVDISLTDGLNYEIFPTKDGFTPTLRNQFSSPDPAMHHHVTASGTPAPLNLVLRSGGSVAGTVTASVTNASPNSMLFGQVVNGANREDVARSLPDGRKRGLPALTFERSPAGPNTYRVSAHDPVLNKGNETKVANALAKDGSVGPYPLNLAGGLPPETVDRQNGNQPTGDASLQGVVTSTNNVPIPFVGVSYQSPNGPGSWGQTDQNGRFTFYGLTEGTTYYAQVYAGCNPSGCFQGYTSLAAETRGASVGPKDIVFSNASAPLKVKIQLQQASPGTGVIPVSVVDQNGDPLPGGNINLWPDGKSWHTNPAQNCSDAFRTGPIPDWPTPWRTQRRATRHSPTPAGKLCLKCVVSFYLRGSAIQRRG
ncbi:MAG: carboxypeptidase regulatory-like domain-containing protein [Elusimicrobia bacterium]|nr:carboxypeptidase regulatory-like domain-containing protein [Elusimicrobiota bacterium]